MTDQTPDQMPAQIPDSDRNLPSGPAAEDSPSENLEDVDGAAPGEAGDGFDEPVDDTFGNADPARDGLGGDAGDQGTDAASVDDDPSDAGLVEDDTPVEGDDEPQDGDDASAAPARAILAAPVEDGVRSGDRIAKVMARAGIASRRDAERMVLEGRVKVNGAAIKSPALDVLPSDRIVVDGNPLEAPQETRVWLYYKPVGLVTSEADEKGRQTIFDALPRDLPRVMTVGRLDLTSEGLLLLTNDGELKRRLELPSTGWMRKYRVRVNGQPNDLTFGPLRRGIEIEGEQFQPMEVEIDSQQGANAWLTVGIREGKNREIRRAMAHVGLTVNRLIRIGYGPFRLTGLEKNEVREVKRRVLRDQLGGLLTGEPEAEGEAPHRGQRGGVRGGPGRSFGGDRDARPRPRAVGGDHDGPRAPRFAGGGDRAGGGDHTRGSFGQRPDRPARFADAERKPREGAARGPKPAWQGEGPRAERGGRFGGSEHPRTEGAGGNGPRRPWQPDGPRPDRPKRFGTGGRSSQDGADSGPRRPWQPDGPRPDRPKRFADGERKSGDRPGAAGQPASGPRNARDQARSDKPWKAGRPRQDGRQDGPDAHAGTDRDRPDRKPRWGAGAGGQSRAPRDEGAPFASGRRDDAPRRERSEGSATSGERARHGAAGGAGERPRSGGSGGAGQPRGKAFGDKPRGPAAGSRGRFGGGGDTGDRPKSGGNFRGGGGSGGKPRPSGDRSPRSPRPSGNRG